MSKTTTYTAIIPTRESAIYDTFGVDIMSDPTEDQDANPVEWIELGAFPENGYDRDAIEDALWERGWRIRWHSDYQPEAEYDVFPVEKR